MSITILATIGPSSLNKDTIEELSSNGVNLFRINLSHTKLDDVANIIDDIHSWTDVPICLDSEGAQVRNQDMESESVEFKEGSKKGLPIKKDVEKLCREKQVPYGAWCHVFESERSNTVESLFKELRKAFSDILKQQIIVT